MNSIMLRLLGSIVVVAICSIALDRPCLAGQGASPRQRPQEPKRPYPYGEQEVIIDNKNAGVKLSGTLTTPNTGGPFPAVLLISGSGPQDRDETIMGHKPFLVLADHLTRIGVAVLRVDDRGVGRSTGAFLECTSEDFAEDVLACIEFLKRRSTIDSARIGLIGHSEGGLIAPMVAARSADVAFVVLMAGPGLPGEEIFYLQGDLIAKAEGVGDAFTKRNRAAQQRLFAIVKEETDRGIIEKKARQEIAALMAAMPEGQRKAAEASPSFVENQIVMLLLPWFRFYLTHDPRTELMKVYCPVLAINGDKDLQVPAPENLSAIAHALKTGGNKDFSIVSLPNLNHLFQTSLTGAISQYHKIEETISPVALSAISDWILKRTNKPLSRRILRIAAP
jgi:pimeloyl-ACP methyl ester carboxylesterase